MAKTGCAWKRIRRLNLMREDPHCWYCGMELHYVETTAGAMPVDYPTIEHLFTRRNGNRIVNNPEDTRRVLACPDCNMSRGRWGDLIRNAVDSGLMTL
jgi:5-methylcytosine-specific restriction endonuclease McrA